MKPIDFVKALGLAVLVLAANLLLTVAAVFVYSQLFARGQSPEFYNALALKIAGWSGPIGGLLLMFGIAWLFGRRRPERNAYAFAATAFVLYALVDTASGLAMAPAAQLFTPVFFASLSLAGVGGLVGAGQANRARRTA